MTSPRTAEDTAELCLALEAGEHFDGGPEPAGADRSDPSHPSSSPNPAARRRPTPRASVPRPSLARPSVPVVPETCGVTDEPVRGPWPGEVLQAARAVRDLFLLRPWLELDHLDVAVDARLLPEVSAAAIELLLDEGVVVRSGRDPRLVVVR